MGKAKPTLVYSPQKRRRATTAELNDDLILEIIARLPLKHAIQCTLLNKTFSHWISDPSFLRQNGLLSSSSRSSNTSHIFHYSTNTLTRITPEISSSVSQPPTTTLPLEPSILASCNGVLLLRFRGRRSHFVFNPITGGISYVDYPLHYSRDVSLAVDLDDTKNFQFKLVTVHTPQQGIVHTPEQGIVKFHVVVPSSGVVGRFMALKSMVKFSCRSFTLMPSIYTCLRPVYVHGCLHWLGNGGKSIIVFDVENEKARMITGPVRGNEPGFHSGVGKWFGFADGSLQFVHTLHEEIEIRSYIYLKDEWQVKHKIAKICSPLNNDWGDAIRVIFDGRRLFVQLHESHEFGVVLVHDILSSEWEKMGRLAEGRPDCVQPFFSFFPTLAEVSDMYLHDYKTESPSTGNFRLLNCAEIRNSLAGLQRLMM